MPKKLNPKLEAKVDPAKKYISDYIANPKTPDYTKIQVAVFDCPHIPAAAKGLFAEICCWAPGKGYADVKAETLRKNMGFAKDTYYKYIDLLRAIGLIEAVYYTDKNGHNRVMFRILDSTKERGSFPSAGDTKTKKEQEEIPIPKNWDEAYSQKFDEPIPKNWDVRTEQVEQLPPLSPPVEPDQHQREEEGGIVLCEEKETKPNTTQRSTQNSDDAFSELVSLCRELSSEKAPDTREGLKYVKSIWDRRIAGGDDGRDIVEAYHLYAREFNEGRKDTMYVQKLFNWLDDNCEDKGATHWLGELRAERAKNAQRRRPPAETWEIKEAYAQVNQDFAALMAETRAKRGSEGDAALVIEDRYFNAHLKEADDAWYAMDARRKAAEMATTPEVDAARAADELRARKALVANMVDRSDFSQMAG